MAANESVLAHGLQKISDGHNRNHEGPLMHFCKAFVALSISITNTGREFLA
jgi:hypothetical protein